MNLSEGIKQINLGTVLPCLNDEEYEDDIISIAKNTTFGNHEKIPLDYKNKYRISGTNKIDITYATITFHYDNNNNGKAPFPNRMAYCCSPAAIELPIFITFATTQTVYDAPFFVKPNGMFEFMIEPFKDINDNTVDEEYEEELVEEIDIKCDLSEISIPIKLGDELLFFTLDYTRLIN